MSSSRPKWGALALAHGAVTASLVLLLVLTGCNKSETTAGAPAAGSGTADGGVTASADAGKGIFDKQGCGRCHALGAGGSRNGPDLTHTGADPSHTAQWIADQIKNPKSHNPSSRMPGYEGRISDADLKTLSEYLAAQK